MPKGLLVVESSPETAARDDEYNAWYNDIHIPEICAIPGVVGARRYRLTGDGGTPRYLAIYDLDAADLQSPVAEMGARAADGRLSPPVALSMDPPPIPRIFELLD
jgi:hypothetical protein